jgi:transposase
MRKIAVVGLDTAKDVFQVHGVDGKGVIVTRRKLARREVVPYFRRLSKCVVGIEACSGGHHWARELAAVGHQVRLVSPEYVKPFVKSQKNDAVDAEAICEAIQRPNMRFVPIKSVDGQAMVILHSARNLLTKQQTMLVNSFRGFLLEFGIVGATGNSGLSVLIAELRKSSVKKLPGCARTALTALLEQLETARAQIRKIDLEIRAWHRSHSESKRLETIPGIGFLTATALAAAIPDPHQFRSGRALSSWLGLVPRQFSSGGKQKLGHITKRGNTRLRSLLVIGARQVIWRVRRTGKSPYVGLLELMSRKPFWVAVVALANRMARVVWALLMKGETFAPRVTARA